jgi:hypothetical protein
MNETVPTMTAADPPENRQPPHLRHEAAVTTRTEAVWLAWYTCLLSLAFAGLGLLLLLLSREHPGVPVFGQWAENAAVAVGFSVLGAIVAPRFPPGNPIGWLFCAIGLVGAMLLFCGEYAAYSLLARPGSLPGGEMMAWTASWLWVAHAGLFAFLALLFPDGRLPTSRWRPFGWILGAAVVAGLVGVAYSPGPIRGLEALPNPLGIDGAPNLRDPVEVVVLALAGVAAVSLAVRLRRAKGVERQQIKLFVYAASLAAVGAMVYYVLSDALNSWWLRWEVGFVVFMIGLVGLPLSLAVAILRYRLHDINLIINLTLVFGLLTAVLAGIFELNVVALQHLVLVLTHEEDSLIAYLATALVMAALFEPLRRRIDAFVEGQLHGRTPKPSTDRPTSENNPSTHSGE